MNPKIIAAMLIIWVCLWASFVLVSVMIAGHA